MGVAVGKQTQIVSSNSPQLSPKTLKPKSKPRRGSFFKLVPTDKFMGPRKRNATVAVSATVRATSVPAIKV
jgi:hypothetical protein